MSRWFLLVLLWACTSFDVQGEKLRVLFVGNSYTFVHGVPGILRQMAEAKGHSFEYEEHTPGGRRFQDHWEEGTAVEKIRQGGFDMVVLQNQSFEPVENPENMMKYGRLLAVEADKIGAEKIYYLTPAYKEPTKWMKKDDAEGLRGMELFPEMHERLVESYSRLARKTKGDIAPVGVAWKQAYKSLPGVQLHAKDHSHAAPTGAYLTALVFYSKFYGEAPGGMPETVNVHVSRRGKERIYDIKVDTETRKALEAIAWKVCSEFSLSPAD
jgi:hypothetical protein